MVGPPDVVAVVAVVAVAVAVAVAEAVEKQSSGLVPWFTSLSPHSMPSRVEHRQSAYIGKNFLIATVLKFRE